MAIDPNILKKLEDDLSNLNEIIDDISKSITNDINKSLAVTSEEAKNLVDEFEKGNDITKKLEGSLKKAFRENRRLGLDQNKLNAELKEAQNELNRKYSEKNKANVKNLQQKIQDNQYQQQLNESVIEYLRTLSQSNEEEKKKTEEKKKQFGLMSLLNKLGLDQLFTFKAILDSVFKVDNQITEMGKSLGISHSMASDLRDSMASYSLASKDAFVTVERLAKAQAGLTEQLGIAVDFGNEERETFARLTEITGLAADEAGRLAKFSAATGTTTKDYVSDLRVAANTAMRANKIHISDKELLSSISKLSAGILVKFQGNPKALAESVIQAKKLGLNLEQVDKTAESLLNFESSIEAELEAELITGKKLNFERARAAALTGDQATLMQEVAAQAGSLAEFQDMNVLAQESLAKAFGMSRDEMSEMLMQQEAINKYGDAAAKLNKEQLEDMERRNMSAEEYLAMVNNQRSTQEKFNDAMLKMQEIIANLVAGPLGSFLSTIANILSHTEALAAVLGGVMVINIMRMLNVLKQAKKISYGQAIVSIIKSAYESIGGLPGIGMVLAGAAAAAGIAYLSTASSKVEDGIAPPGQGPFTIKNKFGQTAITAAGDGLAVSPNIKRTDGNAGMAGVMAAISNLATAVASKPTPTPQFALNVDGQQLGSVVGRQQETGTQQTKNSYRLA